jgi:uncharacterized membrane protein
MPRSKPSKPHVLYLGDWVFHMGPMFVETPFNVVETKDCDLHFYGQRLADALKPKAELTCLSNWELYRLKPGEFESHVRRSACVIVSDVEAKCFNLYPEFFDRSKRTGQVKTYPDRLSFLKRWIAGGGGLMMLGGWLSFSGARETGGWRRSRLAEALPVECLMGEDLVDSSAGFTAEVLVPEHPLAKGLPWDSFAPIFGYNELVPKHDAEVVVRVRETGHPLVVAGTHRKGRVFIYASDPVAHWGINFEIWEGYDRFWQRALNWVQKGRTGTGKARKGD